MFATGIECSNPMSVGRSEEHTSELQSRSDLVCRLLLEKKKKNTCNAGPVQAATESSQYRASRSRQPCVRHSVSQRLRAAGAPHSATSEDFDAVTQNHGS